MPVYSNCKTLSYAEDVQGWPSFYSFCADYMIGMNGFFYTWSGGNLYRHNTNNLRNNYYGVQYNSTITGVLNIEPKTIKLFKTMSYESDDRWACTNLFTDLGDGSMLSTFFEQKEGEWFTFIRENEGTRDYRDRNVNGIGTVITVIGPPAAVQYTFNVEISSILSIGDYMYYSVGGTPIYAGQVTAVDRLNLIVTVDSTIPEPGTNPPVIGTNAPPNSFVFYFKDVVAESHGARGYFMQFTLENTNTRAVELFAVGGSIMKSFP